MSSVLIPGERVRTRGSGARGAWALFGRMRRLDWLLLCALAGVAALGLDVIGTRRRRRCVRRRQEIYLALGGARACACSRSSTSSASGASSGRSTSARSGWSRRSSCSARDARLEALDRAPVLPVPALGARQATLLLALAALIARTRAASGPALRSACIAYDGVADGARLRPARLRHGDRVRRLVALRAVRGGHAPAAPVRSSEASRCISRWPSVVLPAVGIEVLQPYQIDRITWFLHPDRNPLARGLQPCQSKIAIGSGGLVGRGKSARRRRATTSFPSTTPDFMFAVLGEQRGFAGAVALLGLYVLLLWRILRTIAIADTFYGALVAPASSAGYCARCSSTWA